LTHSSEKYKEFSDFSKYDLNIKAVLFDYLSYLFSKQIKVFIQIFFVRFHSTHLTMDTKQPHDTMTDSQNV